MTALKKRLLSILVLLFGSVFVLIACGPNVYDKLQLQLSFTELVVLLDDDAEAGSSTFSVDAIVSGRPKNYAGDVSFQFVTSASANVLELVSVTAPDGGTTTATYTAKNPGRAEIIVRTKQGNKTARAVVNVVRPVKEINFAANNLPVPKGINFSLSEYLQFKPFNTSQKNVNYTLTLLEQDAGLDAELNKIAIKNNTIFVPQDILLTEVMLTATSADTSEEQDPITTTTKLTFVKGVSDDSISLIWDVDANDDSADDLLVEKVNNAFNLQLAKNITELSRMRVYFAIEDGFAEDYIFELKNTEPLLPVYLLQDRNGVLEVVAQNEGTFAFNVLIKQKGYEQFTNLHKTITINVKVSTYPTDLKITDESKVDLNEITLYNVDGGRGVPVMFNVYDNIGPMQRQYFTLSFSDNSVWDKVVVTNFNGTRITRDSKILSPVTLYFKHNLVAEDNVPENITLTATSEMFAQVQSSLNVVFNTEQMKPTIEEAEIRIDKGTPATDPEHGSFEYGYKSIQIFGLPLGFDLNRLAISVENPELIRVVQTETKIGFTSKNVVGETVVTITAPNGEFVSLRVVVFEALNTSPEFTYMEVLGKKFSPLTQEQVNNLTVASLLADESKQVTVKSLWDLPMYFTVNKLLANGFPQGVSTTLEVRDIVNGQETFAMNFVRQKSSQSVLETMGQNGSAIVKVGLTGYNAQGERVERVFFRFIVNVEVPVDRIQVPNQAVIYDRTNLSVSEGALGSFTIPVSVVPSNAKFAFENIRWALSYGGSSIEPFNTSTVGNVVTYKFYLGNTGSVVTLQVNKNNLNEAVVWTELAQSALSTEVFNIDLFIVRPLNQQTGEVYKNFENMSQDRQQEILLSYVAPSARVRFSARKPVKVSDIILDVSHQTLTFDTRRLLPNENGIFTASQSLRTKTISFSVLPVNALTQSIAVSYSGSAIDVLVNNENKTITVIALQQTNKPIVVDVYAKDSEQSEGVFIKSNQLIVELLDGRSEELAYRVSSLQDLKEINLDLNAYYVLTNNINVGDTNWVPIGYERVGNTWQVNKFNGALNGAYTVGGQTYQYSINNLKYSNDSSYFEFNYFGLFAIIGNTPEHENKGVRNVTFNNVNINISDNMHNASDFMYVGVVAGLNEGVVKNNIINDGNQVNANNTQTVLFDTINKLDEGLNGFSLNSIKNGIRVNTQATSKKIIGVGGVVGLNQKTMQNNKSFVMINFDDNSNAAVYAGGVAGINYGKEAVITKDVLTYAHNSSSAVYDVVAAINLHRNLVSSNPQSSIGGVAGANIGGEISYQVSRTVVIKANNNVGGLVGFSAGKSGDNTVGSNAKIVYNLSVPTISGESYVGGLIGFNSDVGYTMLEQSLGLVLTAVDNKYSEVANNRVEFVDNIAHAKSVYNTGVLATNYAGGLIGGNNHSQSTIVFGGEWQYDFGVINNSVFSYYSRATIADPYVAGNENNGSYFGDIVLKRSTPENENQRTVLGGLVGTSAKHGFYAGNTVIANLQANDSVVGGVIGDLFGASVQEHPIVVTNSYVDGFIINRDIEGAVNGAVGAFIGNASKALNTTLHSKASAGNYKDYFDNRISAPSFAVSKSISLLKDESSNLINLPIGEQGADLPMGDPNSVLIAGVGESKQNYLSRLADVVVNNSIGNFNVYAYNSSNEIDTMFGDNGINQSLNAVIKSSVSQIDLNVLGKTQSEINDLKEEVLSAIHGSIAGLAEKVWYMHDDLNSGIPVLLSGRKYVVEFYVLNNTLNYKVVVDLLSNWPPTDIIVSVETNSDYSNKTVFNATQNSTSKAVLFYHRIDSKHYTSNGRQLNFATGSLTSDMIDSLTTSVHNFVREKNTYRLSDVVSLRTIPGFIAQNSVSVVSSAPHILAVEQIGSEIALVALGTGNVNLTIFSNYNPNITKTFNINVVNSILPIANNGEYGLTLNKEEFNTKQKLDRISTVNIVMDNEGFTRAVSLSPNQKNILHTSASANGVVLERTFDMPSNTNGGIRYYILNQTVLNGNTAYSIYSKNETTYHIKLNNKTFNPTITDQTFEAMEGGQVVNKNYYTNYIDVLFGSVATITSNELVTVPMLAVPFVFDSNGKEVLLFDKSFANQNNGVVVSTNASTNQLEILPEFSFVNMVTVQVLHGTWGLNANVQQLSMEPIGDTNFEVAISTDNYNEILFMTYTDELGVSHTVQVDARYNEGGSAVNDSFNTQTSSYEKGENIFVIGDVDVVVSYRFANSKKTYNFTLRVDESKKIDPETLETITQIFATKLNFFVFSELRDLGYHPTKLNLVEFYEGTKLRELEVKVTLIPQSVRNILMTHYPNGDMVATGSEAGVVYSDERAFNNIVPGKPGILKINIVPLFTSFDYLEITASGSGRFTVSFEQLLAHFNKTDGLYDAKYSPVTPTAHKIENGIRLTRQSRLDYTVVRNGQTETRTYLPGVNYDGMFYVRTLISSYADELNNFAITIKGYLNSSSDAVLEQTLMLDVVVPPRLELTHKGLKTAPVAIGTNITFDAKLVGITGFIDTRDSYKIVDGETSGNSGFRIVPLSAGRYELQTDTSMKVGDIIKVVGKVTKTINEVQHVVTDEIQFKMVKFVVDGVHVKRVFNNGFTGKFGEIYDLAVGINATYNPGMPGVEQDILNLERYYSGLQGGEVANNFVWYYRDPLSNQKIKILNTGYSATRSYAIYRGAMNTQGYEGLTGLKLQNIVFNSSDILGAQIMFKYDEGAGSFGGVLPLISPTSSDRDNVYFNEFEVDFGFNFYRDSTEDNPEPIRTVQELMEMQAGEDYILLNDLVLDNWTPISTAIASLDGNGYVITLRSFNLPQVPTNSEGLQNGNVGLFNVVNENTTLKNITIEVAPSNAVSLAQEVSSKNENVPVDLNVNARAYRNINFGLLAGQNNGIITNARVLADAGELRLERDIAIYQNAYAFPSDPDINSDYFNTDGSFKIEEYLQQNLISKYFPRKRILTSVNQPLYLNGSLNYNKLEDVQTRRRDLSIVRVMTWPFAEDQVGQIVQNMGGLVGINNGFITNSAVENVTLSGRGFVGGLVSENNNKLMTSYFKGGNIINRSSTSANSATAGLVVFNNGVVEYSYVAGREGDGNNFRYGSKNITEDNVLGDAVSTPQSGADKTGLEASAKEMFAGVEYNKYAKPVDGVMYDYNFRFGALRSMNSSISSGGDVAGFVFSNNGTVTNAYSNILLDSTGKSSAGFVFVNTARGTIRDVYSLSSVRLNSRNHSPFTGVGANDNYQNTGIIEYSHYLKSSATLTYFSKDENEESLSVDVSDNFFNAGESATAVNYTEFSDYNTFQGFAFNRDYSENKEIERSVWFIPNGKEASVGNTALSRFFKHNHYLQNRPELVGANLRTMSVRRSVSNPDILPDQQEQEVNRYKYVTSKWSLGDSIINPILIRSAEEFNSFVTGTVTRNGAEPFSEGQESGYEKLEQLNSIRLIKDISFNAFDLKAQTYSIDYYGDFDGNGMSINDLRLVSDNNFELDNVNLESLGLFGSISSKIGEDQQEHRGMVRNLNINVGEVRGTKVTYVGVLAGIIKDAGAYNISISGAEIVQGRNVVGGLAGYVTGDSEIVNISINGIGANANYYYSNENPFSTNNTNISANDMGKFTLFNSQELGEKLIINKNNLSYVGGAVGLLDVDSLEENLSSTLRNARARRITVSGTVNLVAEVVGGVFGGVGKTSIASDLDFIVSGITTNNTRATTIKATRVAGGIVGDMRGEINRAQVRHEKSVQDLIDNQLKTQANTQQFNKFVNSINNHNELFSKGNAIYVGGVAGFNFGGSIYNSLNRLNVIAPNSFIAGGLVGFNVGGELKNLYTTATVAAFKTVGGAIGLQVQSNMLTTTYEDVGENNGDYNQEEGEVYVFAGVGKGSYKKTLTLTAGAVSGNLGLGEHADLLFIDYTNAGLSDNFGATLLNGVVAANIWRQQDVDTISRINKYVNVTTNLRIGGLVGQILFSQMHTVVGDDVLRYVLSDAFVLRDTASLENRKYNELNYFNQVFLNSQYSVTNPTSYKQTMPEIGDINGLNGHVTSESSNSEIIFISENKVISRLARNVGSSVADPNTDVRITEITIPGGETKQSISYTGISGNELSIVNDDLTVSFHYSRMHNLSSARTIKEVIERVYVRNQAQFMGEGYLLDNGSYVIVAGGRISQKSEEPDSSNSQMIVELPRIYHKWPINFWQGVEVIKLSDGGYQLINENIVFPQVVPVADLSTVFVYTPEDLQKMEVYKRASFVLMNDIDLSGIPSWEAPGTRSDPFVGRIISQGNRPYTIKGLRMVNNSQNPYSGLVGFADEAVFENFNITVESMDFIVGSQNRENYFGTLLGYGSDVVIRNVHVNTNRGTEQSPIPFEFSANDVAGMGGLAGVVTNSVIQNVSVKNFNLTARSIYEGLGNERRAIGGLVGEFSASFPENAATSGIELSNYTINISRKKVGENYETVNLPAGLEVSEFYVGGLFGLFEGNASVASSLVNAKITSFKEFNVDLSFDSDEENDKLKNIYVGGVFGSAKAVTFVRELGSQNFVLDGLKTSVLLSNYNEQFMLGGFAGYYEGVLSGKGINYASIANVNLLNSSIALTLENINDQINSSIYVGGAFGNNVNTRVRNIESVVDLTIKQENETKTNNLFVGGFAGNIAANAGIKNVSVESNIVINNGDASTTKNLTAKNSYIGGLAGNVASLTSIPNIASLGIKEVGVSGSINAFKVNAESTYVGGLIGKDNNSELEKVISNTNITAKSMSDSGTKIGGIIGATAGTHIIQGQKDGESIDVIVPSFTTISNSYSTGNINYDGNLKNDATDLPQNFVGGVVGFADVSDVEEDREDGAVYILNTYSISKIVLVGKNNLNTQSKGGIIGYVNMPNGVTSENIKTVVVANSYYNKEFSLESNNIGSDLNVVQMLFNNVSTFAGFNQEVEFAHDTESVLTIEDNSPWTIATKHYPLLNFGADSLLASHQVLGTEQRPIELTENLILDNADELENNAYFVNENEVSIVSANPGLMLINTSIISYDAILELNSPISLDENSILFGLSQSFVSVIDENNGLIVGGLFGYNVATHTVAPESGSVVLNNGVIVGAKNIYVEKNENLIHKSQNILFGNGGGTSTHSLISESVLAKNHLDLVGNTNNMKIINSHTPTSEVLDDGLVYFTSTGTLLTSPELNKSGVLSSVTDVVTRKYNPLGLLDTVNTFAVFPNGGQNVGGGYPILRLALKTNYYDNDIASSYYWTGMVNQSDVFGESSLEELLTTDTELLISSDGKTAAIKLAEIAYAASVGQLISTERVVGFDNLDTDGNVVNKTVVTLVDSNYPYLKQVQETSYHYGVKTVTTKKYIDFNGITITIQEHINLANKLWTPIGFDNNLLMEEESDRVKAHNEFKGKINGGGYTISNMSAHAKNGYAGLFGAVKVSDLGTDMLSAFARNVIIKSSYAVGSISSGMLAAKVNIGYDGVQENTIIKNIGVENSYSYSINSSAGILGYITSLNATELLVPKIVRVYANTKVYSQNSAFGIVNNQTTGDALLQEVYFAGEIDGDELIQPIANNAKTSTTKSVYYNIEDHFVTYFGEYVSKSRLQTDNLRGFNWLKDGDWLRVDGENNGYPVFNVYVKYWYDVAEEVVPVGYVYQITTPEQLAWISKKSVEVDLDDVKFFDKPNIVIRLMNDIDLSGRLWTPIDTLSGLFNGNGKTISNIVTYGHHVESGGKPTRDAKANDDVGFIGFGRMLKVENLRIDSDSDKATIFSGRNNVGFIGRGSFVDFKNIIINNVYSYGNEKVGALAGSLENSNTITNVYVHNSTMRGNKYVGAYAGKAENTVLDNHHSYVMSQIPLNLIDSNDDNAANDLYNVVAEGKEYVGGAFGSFNKTSSSGASVTGINIIKATVKSLNGQKADYIGTVAGYYNGSLFEVFIDETSVLEVGTDPQLDGQNAISSKVGGVFGYFNKNKFDIVSTENLVQNILSKVQIIAPNDAGTKGLFAGEVSNSTNTDGDKNIVMVFIESDSSIAMIGNMTTSSTVLPAVIKNYNAGEHGGRTFVGYNFEIVKVSDVIANSTVWESGQNIITKWKNNTVATKDENINGYDYYVIDDSLSNQTKYRYVHWLVSRRINTNNVQRQVNIKLNADLVLVTDSFAIGSKNLDTTLGSETHPYSSIFNGGNNTLQPYLNGTAIGQNAVLSFTGVFNSLIDATVRNLNIDIVEKYGSSVKEYEITSSRHKGILASKANKSEIYDVNIEFKFPSADRVLVYSGADRFGGTVGYATSTILNRVSVVTSSNNVTISGGNYVGGIVGYLEDGSLISGSDYKTTTNVNVQGSYYVGGVVGYLHASMEQASISYVRSQNATITGINYVGGIVGGIQRSSTGLSASVEDSKAYGLEIYGVERVGGIVGGIFSLTSEIVIQDNIVDSTMLYPEYYYDLWTHYYNSSTYAQWGMNGDTFPYPGIESSYQYGLLKGLDVQTTIHNKPPMANVTFGLVVGTKINHANNQVVNGSRIEITGYYYVMNLEKRHVTIGIPDYDMIYTLFRLQAKIRLNNQEALSYVSEENKPYALELTAINLQLDSDNVPISTTNYTYTGSSFTRTLAKVNHGFPQDYFRGQILETSSWNSYY